jgi:hypothetical protein
LIFDFLVLEWADAHKDSETLFQFRPTDAVIYDRCVTDDSFLSHPEYGAPVFSFFKAMPKQIQRIVVVSNMKPPWKAVDSCTVKNTTLFGWLEREFPDKELLYTHGSAFEDFAKVVFAPVVFLDPSSFGLWAAMGNNGTVFSTPVYGRSFPMRNWHFIDAPVLRGIRPAQLPALWEGMTDLSVVLKMGGDVEFARRYVGTVVKYLEEH